MSNTTLSATSAPESSDGPQTVERTALTAASIAELLGGRVIGDPTWTVTGVAPLSSANAQQLSFVGLQAFRKQLSHTAAGIVLVGEADKQGLAATGIVVDNPHVCFAKVAALFDRPAEYELGIHATAVVHPQAVIAESASVGAHCVIGSHVRIGKGVIIGPNSVIMNHCRIGNDTHLRANNTVYQYVEIGERCIIHAGTVIGSDGFGYAVEQGDGAGGSWFKVPQIGTVIIGNDVEIGANSAVDRGALEDTILCNGVKIDNLVQIAHNVYLGENTAIAGSSAVAGSAVIGANCKIMGSVLILGHLELCDGVTISARSLVTRSIRKPGTYSSSISVQEADKWRKNHARLKQLDQWVGRVKTLEKAQRAG